MSSYYQAREACEDIAKKLNLKIVPLNRLYDY